MPSVRRVMISVEVETDADIEELKTCVSDSLIDMVGMRNCTQVSLEQIQTNVIKPKKKK